MAKTLDLRRRIRSIRNTMQVTKAMKMVSAAKLRRAQERIVQARPYAHRMREVLRSLATRANPEGHPLLRVRGDRRVELVVVTADKGLCGSFNTNLYKTATSFLERFGDREITVHCVGRKGRDYFRRRNYAVHREWVDVFRRLDYPTAAEIARDLMDRYVRQELDAVYVVYNEFKSLLRQQPVVERLLPLDREELAAGESREDYLYEPGAAELFDRLLPLHVEVQVYRALLESAAAEHAARMRAMDSATNNAAEFIEKLTLQMNRIRQASITTELIEVVSGAEALGEFA
jgi:F-type H+-transporting ATPase subunit gamma